MAGKLHKDYERYEAGDGQQVAPQERQAKAYAEGYNAARKGAAQSTNPHPLPLIDHEDNFARAWDQGWRDADAGNPSTHVGGPTPAGLLQLAMNDELEAAPWDDMTRHAELDDFIAAEGITAPPSWASMTIAQKKEWLDYNA